MLFELFKAFLVGICASAPLGPVVLLVTQKTLSYGHKTGFSTGLGAAVIDTAYAAICFFAVSLIQDFIFDHQDWIMLIGGGIVVYIGVKTIFKRSELPCNGNTETHYVSNFFRAMGMSLANPGALILMFGIVALFRIDVATGKAPVFLMVTAVFLGAATFWFYFSLIAEKFRRAIQLNHLKWINLFFGIGVTVFGVILMVKGVMMMF